MPTSNLQPSKVRIINDEEKFFLSQPNSLLNETVGLFSNTLLFL